VGPSIVRRWFCTDPPQPIRRARVARNVGR
jgi:hypothetical protein